MLNSLRLQLWYWWLSYVKEPYTKWHLNRSRARLDRAMQELKRTIEQWKPEAR